VAEEDNKQENLTENLEHIAKKAKEKKKSSFSLQKAVLAAIAAIAVGCGGFTLWLNSQGDNKDFAVKGNRMIHVKAGMSTAEVAQLLHDKKLVKSPKAFGLAARFDGLANKLQAGMYQLKGGMSNKEIINTMVKGRVQYVKFVVPEGYSVKKIAQKLQTEELGNADKFLAAAKDYAPYDYMQADKAGINYRADGFAFPATYDFAYGSDEKQMLKIMVETFDKMMEKEGIKKEVKERNLKLHDVVNMAAMVELEAVYAEEQPRIAGVFLKRVDIGMPIQSDTTIQYLLGKQKEVVLYKDLEIDSPYNTYKYNGLPPGPIGSPGISAIKAVLKPEKTDYLYFVAEKDGHHRFTKTFAEHQQAINDIEAGK